MAGPRASACSVAISDGRLLVVGGSGAAGTLNSVDLYATDGSRSQVSPMAEARVNASCTLLDDGRVLVTGGSNESGALHSAEVYDPLADTWKPAGTMAMARSGHTATRMPWGAVLVVGGEDSGTAEAYLTNGTFLTLGKLSTPRTDYAVAVLPDKRILIAGGAAGSTALASIDIFDPGRREHADGAPQLRGSHAVRWHGHVHRRL
jgi:N-acetylneuraminic acid mutarotase